MNRKEDVTMTKLPNQMYAVVTHGPHDYRFEQVDLPTPDEGEILLKVEACGICAGDIKAFKGGEVFWGSSDSPAYLEVPAIGGHEFVGEIIQLGKNPETRLDFGTGDKDFEIGNRVVVEQIAPCGECLYCKNGQYWLCKAHNVFGFKYFLNGGFAEYVKLPKNSNVYRIPKDMPVEKAVLTEPFGCSMHAIDRAKIRKEDVVVISGAGCLGLGMITALKRLQPKLIISLDLVDERLEKAQEFGADLIFNPVNYDIKKVIDGLTDGYGCDVYIEATGHPDSVVQGLNIIKKGGRFVEFSLFNEPVTCNWSVIGDGKELDMFGVSLSPFCFPKVIEGIYDGSLKTEGIVTHSFKLEEFEKAFEVCMNSKDSIKVILKP